MAQLSLLLFECSVGAMVWCLQCCEDVDVDECNGLTSCVGCGRVLSELTFASDVQFTKGADGEGALAGQYIGEGGQARGAHYSGGRMYAGQQGDGHEAAVNRGRNEISKLVNNTPGLTPISEFTDGAHRLYKLAMNHNFTRGRRVNQVAAACLYIYCRQENRAVMLIDFAEQLGINVYVLGAVYLQLLRLFRYDNCQAFTKPVDPSLYLRVFVDRLKLGEKAKAVTSTALKLVQSMKRDWMQTGRRPSGICGAALFISASVHGCECSKKDIIAVVHVGWSTLEKRVIEFAHSQCGELTVRDFEQHTSTFEKDKQQALLEYEQAFATTQAAAAAAAGGPDTQATKPTKQPARAGPSTGDGDTQGEGGEGQGEGEGGEAVEVVDVEEARLERLKAQERTGACEHVDVGAPAFACGMCRSCYEEFLEVSGGVYARSADPPAFTQGKFRELRRQVLALPAPGAPAAPPPAAKPAPAAAAPPQPRAATPPADEDDAAPEDVVQREMDDALRAMEGGAAGGGSQGQGVGAPMAAAVTGAKRASPDGAGGSGVDGADDPAAQPGAAKKVRFDPTAAVADGDTGTAAAAAAAAVAAAAAAAAAAGGAGATAAPAGDGSTGAGAAAEAVVVEEEPDDTLSDVDDEEVSVYIASKEEAEVKELLWSEINKEWIEKQEAKAALQQAEEKSGGPRTKRAYVRRAKPLPPAETAEGAARNMLEAKKLSNKINYSALENMFKDPAGGDRDSGGGEARGGAGSGGDDTEQVPEEQAEEEQPRGRGRAGTSRAGGGWGRGEATGGDAGGGGEEAAVVTAAMKKRAAARAAEQAQDATRYKLALQQEQSRRGAGGLGGGFLGSLTFAQPSGGAGEGGVGGLRQRPQGLGSLKPRTR